MVTANTRSRRRLVMEWGLNPVAMSSTPNGTDVGGTGGGWGSAPVAPPRRTLRHFVIVMCAVVAIGGVGVGSFFAGRSTAGTHQVSSRITTKKRVTVVASYLPVVVCPTTFGITPPPAAKALPSTLQVTTLPKHLSSHIAVYTDNQGRMRLMGPRGWKCSANYGMDGSGGVSIFRRGASAPDSESFTSSTADAIVGSQTSACLGCREGQACPLFTTAASDYLHTYGTVCTRTRPAAEVVKTIYSGVVKFMDPPGVAGDGNPSGGAYAADGVMTYYSGDWNGSWVDTCTLPASDHAICAAALDLFISYYGDR